MAKKVTISVPDELHAKMEKWRASFNFSGIFQKAVSGVIQKKEELEKRVREELDISDVVERLRMEKTEFVDRYRDIGKRAGLEWSKMARYPEILYALRWSPDQDPCKDDQLGAYFSRLFATDPLLACEAPLSLTETTEFREIFTRGWQEAVQIFWNEIKDRV